MEYKLENMAYGNAGAYAPESDNEPVSSFTASPAVVQADGQAIPGELYAKKAPCHGPAVVVGVAMSSMDLPEGKQSPKRAGLQLSAKYPIHGCPVYPSITLPAAVEHDSGAVKVVVSGPTL